MTRNQWRKSHVKEPQLSSYQVCSPSSFLPATGDDIEQGPLGEEGNNGEDGDDGSDLNNCIANEL